VREKSVRPCGTISSDQHHDAVPRRLRDEPSGRGISLGAKPAPKARMLAHADAPIQPKGLRTRWPGFGSVRRFDLVLHNAFTVPRRRDMRKRAETLRRAPADRDRARPLFNRAASVRSFAPKGWVLFSSAVTMNKNAAKPENEKFRRCLLRVIMGLNSSASIVSRRESARSPGPVVRGEEANGSKALQAHVCGVNYWYYGTSGLLPRAPVDGTMVG
jgi:hypothetical protein